MFETRDQAEALEFAMRTAKATGQPCRIFTREVAANAWGQCRMYSDTAEGLVTMCMSVEFVHPLTQKCGRFEISYPDLNPKDYP